MKTTDSEIKDVVNALFASIADDNKQAFNSIPNNQVIERARQQIKDRNTEDFYYLFLYPLSQPIDGFLESEMPGNHQAQFLFKHGDFIDGHFKNIFEKFEGSACSADKSRTVMRCLARFLLDGKKIAFDYEQEYTYHLPKRILTDHDSIINFYTGICDIYYGKLDRYLIAIRDIANGARYDKQQDKT